jgi:twitching motility protein PilT
VLSQAILPRKPEGLVAAFEMMVVTPAVANLVRENKVYRIDSSIQTGRKHGMFRWTRCCSGCGGTTCARRRRSC